jgi:hypothetical protein
MIVLFAGMNSKADIRGQRLQRKLSVLRIQVDRENHSEGTDHLRKIAVVEHTANEDYYQDSSEATGLLG